MLAQAATELQQSQLMLTQAATELRECFTEIFVNVSRRLDNEKRFKDTEFFWFQRNQTGKKMKVPRQTK
jgi:hypothetical protein